MTNTEIFYNYLIDHGIATEDEIILVTNILGDTQETYEDILYARTGYKYFDQLEDFEEN